jgi:hypothetical protein
MQLRPLADRFLTPILMYPRSASGPTAAGMRRTAGVDPFLPVANGRSWEPVSSVTIERSESLKMTFAVEKKPRQARQNECSNGNDAKPKEESRIRPCLQRRQRGRDRQISSEPTIQRAENDYPCDASEDLANSSVLDGCTRSNE